MSCKKANNSRRKTIPRPPAYIYVPETFDPQVALPAALQCHADCARYFLHRIIWGRVQRQLTLEQFVPVKFDYLRAVIPDRVIRPLKRALLDGGVIESDGHYIEGVKSLGYRLGLPHSEARIVRCPLFDPQTAKKVRASRQEECKKVRLDVHKYLRDQYRRLEIDLPLALRLLAGNPNFEVARIPALQIADQDWSFSVCRYGRVHTDLTRCPRVARPALRVEGRPLVEIDVANSQPLFLALLLINYRRHGNKAFAYVTFSDQRKSHYNDVDEIIQKTISYFPQNEDSSPLPPASNTTREKSEQESQIYQDIALATTASDPIRPTPYQELLRDDEHQFVRLCERGRLYEHFLDRMQLTTRKWIKEEFFAVIYGQNSYRSPLKADFTETFPNVAEVVCAHKRKDYAFLPRLLQNIESHFIINTVCRRLMDELPDAPILTIHDCLLTTSGHVDNIVRIMRKEFHRLGLEPSLHVRDYVAIPSESDRNGAGAHGVYSGQRLAL